MEKLKIVLVGVVLLLAAAVVYGYVDDGGDQGPTRPEVTVAESPPQAAPPVSSTPEPATSVPTPESSDRGDPAPERGAPREKADTGGPPQKREAAAASDGAGPPPADQGPSVAVFIKKADRICAKMPARFAKRAEQLQRQRQGQPPEPEDLVRMAAAPTVFEAARELGRLTPPTGDESEAEAMVAALEKVARTVESAPSTELAGKESPFADFAKLAKRFGLERCGQF